MRVFLFLFVGAQCFIAPKRLEYPLNFLFGGPERDALEEEFGDDRGIEDFPLGTPDEEKNVPGEPLTPQDFTNANKIGKGFFLWYLFEFFFCFG